MAQPAGWRAASGEARPVPSSVLCAPRSVSDGVCAGRLSQLRTLALCHGAWPLGHLGAVMVLHAVATVLSSRLCLCSVATRHRSRPVSVLASCASCLSLLCTSGGGRTQGDTQERREEPWGEISTGDTDRRRCHAACCAHRSPPALAARPRHPALIPAPTRLRLQGRRQQGPGRWSHRIRHPRPRLREG